ARQRSMRATIQGSYDLLSGDDAALFRALFAFAGAATLDALANVRGVDELEALDALERLIDASLVRLAPSEGAPRYAMLEPIKQYAMEQLVQSDEHDAATDAVAEWVLARARAL